MKQIFHIRIVVKKTKVDALSNPTSHAYLILTKLVSKLELHVHDNTISLPLVYVNMDVEKEFNK